MSPLSPTVLVVEDHPDSLYIVSRLLDHVGYRVLQARSGEEAAELVRSTMPDLVLMDIAIPGIDGWEATRLIKADPATSHIPVVALTAMALPEDRDRSLEAGCVEHIVKPIEPSAVVAVVRRYVGSPGDVGRASSSPPAPRA